MIVAFWSFYLFWIKCFTHFSSHDKSPDCFLFYILNIYLRNSIVALIDTVSNAVAVRFMKDFKLLQFTPFTKYNTSNRIELKAYTIISKVKHFE